MCAANDPAPHTRWPAAKWRFFVTESGASIDSQNAGRAACVTDLDDRVTRV